MTCYEAYTRKEPGSSDRLMLAVREFASTKVYHLESDFKDFGSTETADDWAQDVSLKVWRQLEGYPRTAGGRIAVHRMAAKRCTGRLHWIVLGSRIGCIPHRPLMEKNGQSKLRCYRRVRRPSRRA